MNFFQVNLNIEQRRSKLFFLFIFLLLLSFTFYIHSAPQEKTSEDLILSDGKLVKEQFFGDYIYRHYVGPPYDFDVFQIYKGEKLVYQSDTGYEYWLRKEEGLFQPGDDITGDGIPNLVVMRNTGGNSFAFSCSVFSLGEQFRLIQGLPEGEFVDINHDGKLECIGYQMGFTNWHACHALSPAPRLIYEYVDDKYLLAPALMYQPLPEEEEINKTIEDLKRSCVKVKEKKRDDSNSWNYGNVCIFSPVWSYMLKLMFSGHPDAAYDFLDKVWPKGEKGKYNFICDFEERVNDTNWPALKPLFTHISEVKKENPSAFLEEEITQGIIRIWAYPENPKVYLNNEYLGEAPLATGLLDPDSYHIHLEQPGYYEVDMNANVAPLHIQQAEAWLKQKKGNSTLFVSTTPDKVEAFLGDTYIGITPLKVENVLAGRHRLVFIKPGYHLKEKIFGVYHGTDCEISVELQEDNTIYAEDVIWIPIIILLFINIL